MGRFLGRMAGRVLKKRTQLAQKNMRLAFPSASDEQVQVWSQQCWESLGMALSEFAKAYGMSEKDYFDWVDVQGTEHLQKAYAKKKGVILFTAHYTNWELILPYMPLTGMPLAVVARRMKNPFVNDLVTRMRSRLNVQVLMHKNAVRESMKWLKKGNVLGLLIDQRITDGGVSVPFLGKAAHTTIMPALLALRMNVPVVPVFSLRVGKQIRVRFCEEMDFSKYEANEADMVKATRDMTQKMEEWIQENPAYWLWIHDRWK